MFEYADETLDSCTEYLDENKKRGQAVTLILGSRTSALFSCQRFYRRMRDYSGFNFPQKERVRQFEECYTILTERGGFTSREVDDILHEDLSAMRVSTTDLYLAALLMQGLFGVVIATRLDDFVEQALSNLGLVSPDSYTVYDGYDEQDYRQVQEHPFTLVNTFGALETRKYRVQRRGYFAARYQLSDFIRTQTGANVFLLGYDPVWDKELGELVPQHGGRIWCVSEDERILEHRELQRLDESRDFVPYIRANGSYDRFIEGLYWRCSGRVPVHYLTQNYIFMQQVALQQEILALKEKVAHLGQIDSSKV
ncbi:MAG TPA: hypothetical protein VGF67_29065 [Ktedonobacteraceae bacterium]|jgi:hypothetical protein